MLYGEIITVCSQIHTKQINTVGVQNLLMLYLLVHKLVPKYEGLIKHKNKLSNIKEQYSFFLMSSSLTCTSDTPKQDFRIAYAATTTSYQQNTVYHTAI